MEKKGDFFTNNVLGIVIAVIGIVVFVYAFAKLYDLNTNQENDKAKVVLDSIISKAQVVPEGVTANVTIQGISGWYLAGWSADDSTRPDRCYNQGCVCICPGSASTVVCQKSGICKRVSEKKVNVSSRPFDSMVNLGAAGTGAPPALTTVTFYRSCIPLTSLLSEISIARGSSSISLSASGDSKFDYSSCAAYHSEPSVPISTTFR